MNAEGSDYDVYGFPWGYASFPKNPVVLCTFKGDSPVHHWHEWHAQEEFLRDLEFFIVLKPLEYFGQDQIAHYDWCASESGIQPIRLPCLLAVEVVDPDR